MPLNDYAKLLLNIGKGASGTGALMGQLSDRSNRVTLEPGDMAMMDGEGGIRRKQASPIAYDLWYLKHWVNMLMLDPVPLEVVPQEYLDENLDFLADQLSDLKPMKIIRNLEDLVKTSQDYWFDVRIDPIWKNNGEYFINLMAFEMWFQGQAAINDSEGPDTKYGFKKQDCVGYLAIPCGQLGVMEVVSVLRQTVVEADGFSVTDNEAPNVQSICDFFFPPVDEYTGKNECLGEHWFESGYLMADSKKRNLEFINTSGIASYGDIRPQLWTRYWIAKDETWPTPGEFLAVLCKPMALPPHVWWFQESTPFIYAGNWFETHNLTGGVVTQVTLQADRDDNKPGNEYTVKVQGIEIIIYSDDFWEFAVDDRVGIIKTGSVTTSPKTDAFLWSDQVRLGDADRGQKKSEYVILPIEFFNN